VLLKNEVLWDVTKRITWGITGYLYNALDKINITHLKIYNFTFENVENFIYLGSILNADNKMNIEIAEKIAKGNKAY
jgi:hypothetical protein